MNSPKPNDDLTALRQALHRDAEHLPEPSFDPALHSATVRRIRALSGKESVRDGWLSIRAGMVGAALLILIGWTMPLWHHPANSERIHRAQTHPGQPRDPEGNPAVDPLEDEKAENTSDGSDRTPDSVFFNLASFTNQRLRYAMLDAGLSVEPARGFPLDMPTGPMRLDCTYASAGNDPANSLFGRFHFNVSN